MDLRSHYVEHRALFASLKWACVATVVVFLLLSVGFSIQVCSTLLLSAQGGMYCATPITGPLQAILNIALPTTACASLVLGVFAFVKLCSLKVVLPLVAAFAATAICEILFAVGVYHTLLPGCSRDLVWWFRSF
jgi:hypothetical protein